MNSVVLALFPCLLATTVVGAAVPHRAKQSGVRRVVAEQVEDSARLQELVAFEQAPGLQLATDQAGLPLLVHPGRLVSAPGTSAAH